MRDPGAKPFAAPIWRRDVSTSMKIFAIALGLYAVSQAALAVLAIVRFVTGH